ncbi:hypothetical protein HF1_15260 [Mycoplasma haemofelis str. Langford 1]|uniref:Uncharacterized protein n=2 Tax=Mycoplasma haemofelis TaxID=29501 RepID=F6FHR3_MYCHI|nr:hypothetical protein [Mycoplasma haemofelis]AEG73827.1 hypothetical protein MHF_1597 [Mycoplasma haemofelis Ohio2]CBY93534.1 hypothetical protein HF1_15260 [Mycoplasma haemofelis str. Langford 1]
MISRLIKRIKRSIKRKLRTIKLRIIYSIRSIKIVAFYLDRKVAKVEFKEIARKNAGLAISKLIEGSGGTKNLVKVKNTRNNLQIWVKFRPLLQESILKESGGIGLRIKGKIISVIFVPDECLDIANSLRLEMSKLNLRPLDEE